MREFGLRTYMRVPQKDLIHVATVEPANGDEVLYQLTVIEAKVRGSALNGGSAFDAVTRASLRQGSEGTHSNSLPVLLNTTTATSAEHKMPNS